jgi:GDPmannose 4,6-dehydratase
VDALVGDAAKARRVLGWEHKTGFGELVAEMVKADIRLAATNAGEAD